METGLSGQLVLCGTPIGNLEDMSPRAVRTLAEADVIACEDTRRARKLLTHHGIRARDLVVYNDANEQRQATELVGRVARGERVVLISDAGMPGLSDPGYRLVRGCIDAGLSVTVVPGPSAVVAALAISGLAPGRFVFEGFLPRKSSERRRHLDEVREEPRTLVFYESPHRIEKSLVDLHEVLGDRPVVLARELTKMHEQVRRGPLSEVLRSVREDPPRGEIVVVVAGATGAHRPAIGKADLARRARALMEEGMERRAALQTVAREAGVGRREVFNALVEQGDRED